MRRKEAIIAPPVPAIALIDGLMVSPFLGRLLPFGLDGRLAATIMGADRWNAGAALMATQSPEAWHIFMDDVTLMKSKQAALSVCHEAVVKANKEQHCNFLVPAP